MILVKPEWASTRERLEELFLASFARPIQPGYLDWRYADNTHGDLFFSIETSPPDVVASYSLFPVALVVDAQTYATAMSMTTMTHPGWRGKGLFPKLAGELYAHASSKDLGAVWGFPNTSSHAQFIGKLGWKDIYEIPTMTLDLGKADPRLSGSDSVSTDDSFALEYPDAPRDGLIRVNRTTPYLRWRYARNPVNAYRNFVLASEGRVSSYVVTKSFGGGLDLVDIQIAKPEEAAILLSHVAAAARDQRLTSLHCWAPTHHWVHGALERLGFQNTAPITYFAARELVVSAAPPDWRDNRRWYYQMGDSDVY